MESMDAIFGAVAVAAPIAIALVSLAKQQGLPERLAPAASLAAGIVIVLLLILAEAIEMTVGQAALTGVLAGLAASGTYSGVRAVAKG